MKNLIRPLVRTFKSQPKPIVPFRSYSTENNHGITYLKHRFSPQEAANIYNTYDAGRLFAPFALNSTNQMVLSDSNPLKKMLLPMYAINVSLSAASYQGSYGKPEVRYTTDEKGAVRAEYYTDWYDISGTLDPMRLNEGDWGMSVYGGFQLPPKLIEDSFSGYQYAANCIPFDLNLITEDTIIDPFLKRASLAQETSYKRILQIQTRRAEQDIKNRMGYSSVDVRSVNYGIEHIKLTAHMLPVYILQYPDLPVRILPAIDDRTVIFGPNAFSVVKTSAATFALGSLAAVFLAPQIAIPARFALVFVPTFLTALIAKFKTPIQNSQQLRQNIEQKIKNEELSESIKDRERREATEKKRVKVDLIIDGEPRYFELLGLSPNQQYTEKEIKEAYLKKIKEVHPDIKGSTPEYTAAATELNNAKMVLLKKNFGDQKRFYSTVSVRLPPRSIFHPSAGQLIKTILDEKNYPKAIAMVRDQEISADSHDMRENTPLTEAAKRGDLKAMEFIIDTLRASPDTSCDCPAHRTALHYAAANGDNNVVSFLLKKGANPNLLNSNGETATDIAIAKDFKKVAEILRTAGGIPNPHKNRLIFRFFGYSSSERNLLGAPEKPSKNESVISLPSSDGSRNK